MPTFSTAFTPPPPVSGLEVEADLDASAVRLSWGASSVAEVDFGGYRVYKSSDGGLTFTLARLLPTTGEVSWEDYTAPLNVNLVYRVTQSNLDFESDPEDVTVALTSEAWHVVTPGDSSMTFPIRRQTGAAMTAHKVQDVFSPAGRRGKLVVGDVVQIEDGSVSFMVRPDELGTLTLWSRVQGRMEGTLILKATDGSVWEVKYGDISRSFKQGGMQELSIPFIGVG